MLPLFSPHHPQTAAAKSSLFRSDIWPGWQKEREHTSHWSLSLSSTKAKGHFPKGQLQVRAVTLPSSADIGARFPGRSAEVRLWPTKEKLPHWDLSTHLKGAPDNPCSSPLSVFVSREEKADEASHPIAPPESFPPMREAVHACIVPGMSLYFAGSGLKCD